MTNDHDKLSIVPPMARKPSQQDLLSFFGHLDRTVEAAKHLRKVAYKTRDGDAMLPSIREFHLHANNMLNAFDHWTRPDDGDTLWPKRHDRK